MLNEFTLTAVVNRIEVLTPDYDIVTFVVDHEGLPEGLSSFVTRGDSFWRVFPVGQHGLQVGERWEGIFNLKES